MSGNRRTAPATAADLRAAILADVHRDLDAITAAERRHHDAIRAVREEADRIRAEHAADVARAADLREARPPMPDLPDALPNRQALAALLTERTAVTARRQATLAAAADDVEAAWQAARVTLDDRARNLAGALDDLAREYGDWWHLVRDTRRAAEHTNPAEVPRDGPSTRMGSRPAPVDVLNAVTAGADILAPTPLSIPARPATEPTAATHHRRAYGATGALWEV